MRILLVAVSAAVLGAATPETPRAAALPFRATLTATGHQPKLGTPWYFMVRVTDLRGRPIAASILPMIMQGNRRLDTVGSFLIWGACGQPHNWRRTHVGRQLTFRVQVQARGRNVNLDYAVRVRR